jgi:hypothetical protein
VALVLYKYILTQTNLVKATSGWLWVLIAVLLFFSCVLGGLETAVTRIGNESLKLSGLLLDLSLRRNRLDERMSDGVFDSISIIRKIAHLLFYLREELLVESFSITKASMAADGTVRRERQIDIEKCISLTLTAGVIIDVNITVLFSLALQSSDVFSHNGLSFGFIGQNPTLEKWLPLAGSSGFTSVGVSIIILLFVEALPKKAAYKSPELFIRYGALFIAPIYLAYVPKLISENVDRTADFLIDSAVGIGRRVSRPPSQR